MFIKSLVVTLLWYLFGIILLSQLLHTSKTLIKKFKVHHIFIILVMSFTQLVT